MERSKEQQRQRRRAVNLIWTAAGDYSLQPEFCAFTPDGQADLYLNTIIGTVYACYDYAALSRLFASFRGEAQEELFSDLVWLALEHCAYSRAADSRPALAALRQTYARTLMGTAHNWRDRWRWERLQCGHFQRALGIETHLSPRENRILDGLEPDPTLDTPALVAALCALFRDYFHFTPNLNKAPPKKRHRHVGRFRFGRRLSGDATYSPVARTSAYQGGEGPVQTGSPLARLMDPNEESLRRFLTQTYGASLYDPGKTAELEARLCTQSHAGCRLHVTRGDPPPGNTGNHALDLERQSTIKQQAANRAYYEAHSAENRVILARLTAEIRNCLLLHAQPAPVRAKAGLLQSERVWRSQILQDQRVFYRVPQDEPGTLSVDLLLDGSASQLLRQERVATQGYLLAESLAACGVPVRVTAFCNVSGCGVIRLFRDYHETGQSGRIFDYHASGWNRDGLALRVVGDMASRSPCTHKLLIILSDASPNDDRKIPGGGAFGGGEDYGGAAGIADTAAEVVRVRKSGVCVLCVFTGEDAALPAAQKIYGRGLARIPSIDRFADTVGRLIRDEIEGMA
ncbi:MAG: hypothetical protein RR403_03930 [Pseudoflavonifractor sp.]